MSTQAVDSDRAGAEIALRAILITLFEHSDVLEQHLLPVLLATSAQPSLRMSQPSDVQDILSRSLDIIRHWDPELRAQFVGGHPRIGETKNLSSHSFTEQGGLASQTTPPEVLARLSHLNACYERVYPGLRYITFVNGRSRAIIAQDMEDRLGLEHSLSPDQPPIEDFIPVEKCSQGWLQELDGAVEDVGRIAQSRLYKSFAGRQQESSEQIHP